MRRAFAARTFTSMEPRDDRGTGGAVPARWSWGACGLVALGGCVSLLCAVGVIDIIAFRQLFPIWFPALFAGGVACFVWLLMMQVRDSIAPFGAGRMREDRTMHVAWGILAASWVCTTAVHQFFPFRQGGVAWMVGEADSWMALNGPIAIAGLVTTLAWWCAYAHGYRGFAVTAAIAVAMIALLPNDTCANPFNTRWIAWCGGSPLMFVPNGMCLVFAVGVLVDVRPMLSLGVAFATCCGTLFLGLGHYLRFIW